MSVRSCPACKKNKLLRQQKAYKPAPKLPCKFTFIQVQELFAKVIANPQSIRDNQIVRSAINTYFKNCNSLANELQKLSERYL